MRWVQRKDPDTGRYVLLPADGAAAERDAQLGIVVKGNFDAFRSPIDGSVISTYRDYEDHCRKHNVVPAAEFSDEFLARKRQEREDFYMGKRTPGQVRKDRQEIYERWVEAERKNGS